METGRVELRIWCLCCTILITQVSSVNASTVKMGASLEGDVILGGLFQIYDADGQKCSSNIDIMSVRDYEAVKWTLNKLNEANYIPGVNIGMETFATCNVDGSAMSHTTHFVNRAIADSKNSSSRPLIGLVGPENSGEVEDTSRYVSSLSEDQRLLQMIFSATASELSNGENYKNILRTIPSDETQSKVIVDLMVAMEWNYIGVIYENSTYGRGGFTNLHSLSKKKAICIAKSFPLQVGNNNAVSSSELQNVINSIVVNTESPITGVVVFASSAAVRSLLLVTQNLYSSIQFRLSMIVSETTALDTALFAQRDVSKGAFLSSPPLIFQSEFLNHWESILTNRSKLNYEVSTNPWLNDVLRSLKPCESNSNPCPIHMLTQEEAKANLDLNVFESYAILSTLSFAYILKSLHFQKCGSSNSLCSQLNAILHQKKNELIKGGRTAMQIDVKHFPVTFSQNLSLIFSKGPNIEIKGEIPDYEVYQYRHCLDSADQFCLEKVAMYLSGGLTLNTTLLKDYYENSNGHNWPNINKAQCATGKTCTSCQNENIVDEIYFKEGDFYILGVVPVYDKGTTPLSCSNVRTINGWEIVEGIAFAVETVNAKEGIFSKHFPNKVIGHIILNSCNQPLLVKSKLMSVLRNGISLSNGTNIFLSSKILGVVAELGSSISVASAEVLQEFNLVQIAYASTARTLSDRNLFKYFLRVCTPDNQQIVAMLKIIADLKSDYIQLLYNEGTYGEGARDTLIKEAKNFHICVASIIKVEEHKYTTILDDLRKTPYAKIVVLFLKSHVVLDVLNYLHDVQTMDDGEFLFIASEAFGIRPELIKNKRQLEGTISLSLEFEGSGFSLQKYIFNKLKNGDYSNPWTKVYIEKTNSCFLSGSFDKSSKLKCSDNYKPYNESDFQQQIWTPFAMNAALSLLNGTNEALGILCSKNAEEICTDYKIRPHDVWQHIAKQEFILNGIATRLFDDNGDGNVGYHINQVKRDTSSQGLEYTRIGRFSLGVNGYSLNKDLVIDPFKVLPSKCPNPKECDICKKTYTENKTEIILESTNDKTPQVTGLGVTLGLTITVLVIVIIICIRKNYLNRNSGENARDSTYEKAVELDDPYLQAT